MLQTIWLMWRPGEERKYAMCVQPPKAWADIQKANGFYIASFEVELPDDPANFKLGTVAGNVLVSRELRVEHDPDAPVVKLASVSAGYSPSPGTIAT